MKHVFLAVGLSLVALASGHAETPASLKVEATGAPELALRGKDARQQLLVTAKLGGGELRDFTHKVEYKAAPAGIVSVDENGLVSAVADGAAVAQACEVVFTSLPAPPALSFIEDDYPRALAEAKASG